MSDGIKFSLSHTLLDALRPIQSDGSACKIARSAGMLLSAPIGLIEAVVRTAFALLATPIALFLPPGEGRDWYQEHIFSPLATGALMSFITFLSAVPAAVILFSLTVIGDEVSMPPSIWSCCTSQSSQSSDSYNLHDGKKGRQTNYVNDGYDSDGSDSYNLQAGWRDRSANYGSDGSDGSDEDEVDPLIGDK